MSLQIKDLFDPSFKDAFIQIMSEKLDIEQTRDVLRYKKEAEAEMTLTRDTFMHYQKQLEAGDVEVKKQWEDYLDRPLEIKSLPHEIVSQLKKVTASELLLIDKMCS